jgi:hypothetical protein
MLLVEYLVHYFLPEAELGFPRFVVMKAGHILSISLGTDKAVCCNITAAGSKASVRYHPCDLYPSPSV